MNEPSTTVVETPSADDQKADGGTNGETPSSIDSVNVDEVVSGWKSDRDRLSQIERENFELRKKLSTTDKSDDDDDEDGLSMDERVDKKLAQRLKDEEETKKFSIEQAEREAEFMRRVSPVFRKNEKSIIQIAVDGKMNLSEATKVYETRNQAKSDAKEEIDKDRKKVASQGQASPSSGSAGKPATKSDKNKSVSELYREGLGY